MCHVEYTRDRKSMATCTATTPSKKLAQNQQQGTLSVEECDGDPEWKHDVQIDLAGISLWDCDHVFLRFVLFHEGVMLLISLCYACSFLIVISLWIPTSGGREGDCIDLPLFQIADLLFGLYQLPTSTFHMNEQHTLCQPI